MFSSLSNLCKIIKFDSKFTQRLKVSVQYRAIRNFTISMYDFLIILVILAGSVGVLLYFVGWMNTIFMALGKKQYSMGAVLFILNPLSIVYCIKNWQDASKQGKQLIIGFVLMCCTIIPSYFFIDKISF